jgi:hypothetical protein
VKIKVYTDNPRCPDGKMIFYCFETNATWHFYEIKDKEGSRVYDFKRREKRPPLIKFVMELQKV